MGQPTKEYHVRVGVKLSEDILPVPAVSREELHALLTEQLAVGEPGSVIVSVSVSDPSDRRPRKRY